MPISEVAYTVGRKELPTGSLHWCIELYQVAVLGRVTEHIPEEMCFSLAPVLKDERQAHQVIYA